MSTNKGIKLTFETELDEWYSSDKEGVGTIRHEGDQEFIWLEGVDSSLKGAVVAFSTDYVASLASNTMSPGARLAVACTAASGDYYGWNQIRGNVTTGDGWGIYAAKRCAPSLVLNTTGTGGLVDNQNAASASGLIIYGMGVDIVGTDPASGNGTTQTGWLNYPNAVSAL